MRSGAPLRKARPGSPGQFPQRCKDRSDGLCGSSQDDSGPASDERRQSHRGVEGLVVEWKALRGGSYARRRSCGTLRMTVDGSTAVTSRSGARRSRCQPQGSARSVHRRVRPKPVRQSEARSAGSRCTWLRWCHTTARWTSSRTLRHDRQGSSEPRTLALGRPGSGAIPLNADCGACQPSGSRLRPRGTRSCPFAAIAAARSPQW
jgi:hypothetical protein